MAINADEAENPDGEDSQEVNNEAWLQDLEIGDEEDTECSEEDLNSEEDGEGQGSSKTGEISVQEETRDTDTGEERIEEEQRTRCTHMELGFYIKTHAQK